MGLSVLLSRRQAFCPDHYLDIPLPSSFFERYRLAALCIAGGVLDKESIQDNELLVIEVLANRRLGEDGIVL